MSVYYIAYYANQINNVSMKDCPQAEEGSQLGGANRQTRNFSVVLKSKMLWSTLKIRWGFSPVAPSFLLPMELSESTLYYCQCSYVCNYVVMLVIAKLFFTCVHNALQWLYSQKPGHVRNEVCYLYEPNHLFPHIFILNLLCAKQ